jgi:hypothetical protein
MKFKTMAVLTSAIGLVLGSGYLLFGTIILGRWQVEPTVGSLLLARRIGCLYLGLAAMLFLGRSAAACAARTALSFGMALGLSLTALSGVYEHLAGHAGKGILLSSGLEILLALGFISVLIADRRAAGGQ